VPDWHTEGGTKLENQNMCLFFFLVASVQFHFRRAAFASILKSRVGKPRLQLYELMVSWFIMNRESES
jgi:hypothetical protein